MSKRAKIIGASIGLGILIIALAAFFAPTENQPVMNQPSPTSSVSQSNKPVSYQQFVKSGKSSVCTFATNLDNTVTTGTVYAAYGKVRTDFVQTLPGGTAHQHVLVDTFMAYLWSNASNQGVKFAVEEASPNSRLDTVFGQNKNYKCTEQPVDMKAFELPADVAFTDITGLK